LFHKQGKKKNASSLFIS